MLRARRLAIVATAVLAAAAVPSLADEPKAPASPEDIVEYYESGEYNSDTTAVVRKARAYVKKRLRAKRPPRKPAVVLDIDDTALSLYACGKERNFENVVICAVETDLPAIRQVRSFFKFVRERKVAVFFITGRPEPLREITVTALRTAGYGRRLKIYLRPEDDGAASPAPYKTRTRKAIARRGFQILANLGDQRSDLRGGFAAKAYKLPNPMYFTP